MATATVRSIGGCSGRGVTDATFTDSYQYLGNGTTFVTGKGQVTTPAPSSDQLEQWSVVDRHDDRDLAQRRLSDADRPEADEQTHGRQLPSRRPQALPRPSRICTKTGLTNVTLTGPVSFTFKQGAARNATC